MMLKSKKWILGVVMLSTMTFAVCAAADDADPMAACDSGYAECNSKCDAMENAPAECYGTCDDTFQRCLDVANGYPPAPVKKAEVPKKMAKVEKKGAGALKRQNKGTDPDGAGHQQ